MQHGFPYSKTSHFQAFEPAGHLPYASNLDLSLSTSAYYFAEFKSILLFRQHHQMRNAFDKSDIYIVCRMEPLSFGISHCEDEIAKCEWMKLSTLVTHTDTTPLTKLAARLTLHGLKNGFESVDIVGNRVQSWVNPNQTFSLFHRYLPS